TITVSAGAATHFTVSAPASAASGLPFNVTVTALDAFNNTATAYAGTVHFTSTDVQAVLPADTPLSGGVGALTARLQTGGSQTIKATDTATASITGTSGSIIVLQTVYSGPSATGTGTITASVTGGGGTCTFTTAQLIGAPPGAAPVPSTTPGFNITFPQGM